MCSPMPDVPDEVWAEVDADMEADKRAMDRPVSRQKPITRENRRLCYREHWKGVECPEYWCWWNG